MHKLNALFIAPFITGLFLTVTGCSVGTVTASCRIPGSGGPSSLGHIGEANSPANTDDAKASKISQRDTSRGHDSGFKSRCRRCDGSDN